MGLDITQRIRNRFFGKGEKSHQFWNTQPCTQYGDVIETSVNTFIEDDVDPAKVCCSFFLGNSFLDP